MEDIPIKENERIDDLQYKDLKIIQETDGFCFGIDRNWNWNYRTSFMQKN